MAALFPPAIRHAIAVFLTLVPHAAYAQTTLPAPVAAALSAAAIPSGSVAAFVQQVGGAKPVVAFNAAQPLNPASTMKLVTTYAALELLGPTFTWKTEA